MLARGAAMLGLIDPPAKVGQVKRKLLGQDTPGGPAYYRVKKIRIITLKQNKVCLLRVDFLFF